MIEAIGSFFGGTTALSALAVVAGFVLFLVNPKHDNAIVIARLSLAVLIVSVCCLFFAPCWRSVMLVHGCFGDYNYGRNKSTDLCVK